MSLKIALAGNPNCGKTTMFNALTGSSQYVGNWPGVTVEKKSGHFKGDKSIEIIDLPGIYSLSPYTLEEVVARNYLLNDKPDIIINIIDSTNIERNLYLTTQILEIGIPVVVALNMTDIIKKLGDKIDKDKLSAILRCPVVETSALKGGGLDNAVQVAVALSKDRPVVSPPFAFSEKVKGAIGKIEEIIKPTIENNTYFSAIKLFERDKKLVETTVNFTSKIEPIIFACENEFDDDSESIIINERYSFIDMVVKECFIRKNKSNETASDKVDKIVTSRYLALPIFAGVMFLIYYISVTTIGTWLTDWTNDVLFGDVIPPMVEGFLVSVGTAQWLNSLILDGIIGGVGAVIGFVPQLLVLFFFLALLEDCGYMARVAFIMDRIFRKFGLSGKSFIPMLIGTGCSVPGIMASRTIENESERKMTIITTSFIPCGAKLPIIALIAGALFGGAWWLAPSAYFIGVLAIIISGIILKKSSRFAGEPSPFVMELPNYHVPDLKTVLSHTWERGWSFIKKAGTVIFLSCGVIWFLSNFNFSLQMVETTESMLAALGKVIAPIFAPLGFGNWQSAVAVFTGLIAKENVVGTLAVLFGFAEVSENGAEIWSVVAQNFTMLSAFSFLVFNLLCAPCFAAVGAIKREMGDFKWTAFAVGYQTGFAYVMAMIIYQLGMFFAGNSFTIFTGISIGLLVALVYLLVRKNKYATLPQPSLSSPSAKTKIEV